MTRIELLRSHAVAARQSRPPAPRDIAADPLGWVVAFTVMFLAGAVLGLAFIR